MNSVKYNFSADFEEMILACALRHPNEFMPIMDRIDPHYFNHSEGFDTAHELDELAKRYGRFPTFTTLGNLLWNRYRDEPEHASACVEYIKKLTALDTSDHAIVRDMLIEFVPRQRVKR